MMDALQRTLALGVCTLSVLSGCASAPQRAGTLVPRRSQIVPLVEHHSHLVGSVLLPTPPPPLPVITLPPELDRVLRERERLSGTSAPSDLYTEDAQVLDISEGEDHWVRGRAQAQSMASAYTPDTHFVPNAYSIDGSVGYIAGTCRTGDSPVDDMHFAFGLKKDARGVWRIAIEYATAKPPLMFAEPITAERLVAHLDDAGIQRGVVLSVAYWLGSPLRSRPVENEAAKVREANDWTIEQVGRYPDRLVAFCSVNPLKDYAIDELVRCSRLPHVKGMKLHFGNSRIDVKNPQHVEQVRRFFRAANEHRMALVAHLWTLDKSYGAEHSRIFLEQILPEAPDVPVQIAHMAGAGRYVHDDAMAVFADAITAGDPRMKNVYFDLTTVVDEGISKEMLDLLAKRIRQVGLSRILYGSDTPTSNRPPPMLAWAITRRRLPLTDDEIQVIANNVAPYLR